MRRSASARAGAIMVAGLLWLPAQGPAAAPAGGSASNAGDEALEPFPDVPNDMNEAQAYVLQRGLVASVYGDALAGLKAGLTNGAVRERYGAEQPVLGVLPASGATVDERVALVPGLKIELEIAFRVDAVEGEQPVLGAALPAVELPRLHYANPDGVAVADIVVSNVAAYRFLVGDSKAVPDDLAHLSVRLTRDGEPIASGRGSDALGDPRAAAEWLLRKADELGYAVEPGMVLLTGALGPVVDATPGRYRADFGSLGIIDFTIEPDRKAR